jgi:hypothetical protein
VDELDKEFRTSQAQNRASFMHDVMSDEGAMLPLGQGTDR